MRENSLKEGFFTHLAVGGLPVLSSLRQLGGGAETTMEPPRFAVDFTVASPPPYRMDNHDALDPNAED